MAAYNMQNPMKVKLVLAVAILVSIILTFSCGVQPSEAQTTNNNQTFVTLHNDARAAVNVSGLVWNATLFSYALTYATQQASAYNNCALVHSGGPYGENLWWGSWVNATPDSAVNAWVSEKQFYNYTTNTCATGKVCGHYTQVVWANTKRLGCASVNCQGTRTGTFTVCSYDPPGNYVGQKPY